MARIAGIDLPREKRIEIGLTYIYGIGRKSAQDILAQTGINFDTRVKDLTEEEEAKLREAIDQSYVVEGDLRHLAYEGARQLYGDPLPADVDEHVNFELHVMKTMGFPGYFLIVSDFIRAAREELGVMVGPGRGSKLMM